MAWESKRALRERVQQQGFDLADAQNEIRRTRMYLEDFGYEEVDGEYINWARIPSRIKVWRKSELQKVVEEAEQEAAKTKRESELLSAVEEAYAASRQATLAAVIDALGIKGYAPSRLHSLFGSTEASEKLTAEQEALQNAHLDRFWNDIQTTLRVREERKRAEADAKTEERISGLAKPAEKPLEKRAFGPISFGGAATDTLNSTVSSQMNDLAVAIGKLAEPQITKKESGGKKGKQ